MRQSLFFSMRNVSLQNVGKPGTEENILNGSVNQQISEIPVLSNDNITAMVKRKFNRLTKRQHKINFNNHLHFHLPFLIKFFERSKIIIIPSFGYFFVFFIRNVGMP